MPRRRTLKAANRAENYVTQIRDAPTGWQALSIAWRWLLSEMKNAREFRPRVVEAAAWEMARFIAAYACRLPKAVITLRSGLTDEEVARLLNPWAKEGAEQ
jgi:hypothetical protein